MRSQNLVALLIISLLMLIGGLPLIFLLTQSVVDHGSFTLRYYADLFSSPQQWRLLGNSIALASLVVVGSGTLGIPLALLFGRTNLPFRNLWLLVFSSPLFLPPFILAVGWFQILGRQGFMGQLFGTRLSETTSAWLFGLPGCAFILSLAFMPVVLLLNYAFLKSVPSQLEEAAMLSCGSKDVLKNITFPIIAPGMFLSFVLVFLLALGELTVPLFLRFDVFAVQSLTQFAAFYNFNAAAAAAVPLALIALVFILAERRVVQRTVHLTQTKSPLLLRLNSPHLQSFCLTVLFFVLIAAPVVALARQSFDVTVISAALSQGINSLRRSLLYSVIAAALLTILGFYLAYFIRKKSAVWQAVDCFTLLLFALPGTVIGVGLIRLWNRPWSSVIYTTSIILLFGYIAQYVFLTSRALATAINRLNPSLESAAELAGAGWFSRLVFITVPLIWRALIVSWLAAYIFCFRDTGIAMMLYPPGKDTLPVRIFTLMANSPPEIISALCLILVLATGLPLLLLALFLKPKRRND